MGAGKKAKFRRAGRRAEWHFDSRCPDWPTGRFESSAATPPAAEFCQKCVELVTRKIMWDVIGPVGKPRGLDF
jgi:hypothetical protein